MAERSKSAVEELLRRARDMHVLARSALAESEPNLAAAKEFMQLAISAGRRAAPLHSRSKSPKAHRR